MTHVQTELLGGFNKRKSTCQYGGLNAHAISADAHSAGNARRQSDCHWVTGAAKARAMRITEATDHP